MDRRKQSPLVVVVIIFLGDKMSEVDFIKYLKKEYNIVLYDKDSKEYIPDRIIEQFYQKKYEEDKIIDEFKKCFKQDFEDDIDNIIIYLPIILLFSGDFTNVIYKEMLAIIDKIKQDSYSTDRDGFVKYLKENNYHH